MHYFGYECGKNAKQLGICLKKMYKPIDALDYLQQSLKLFGNVSLDMALDINLAKMVSGMDGYFMDRHKWADANRVN